MDGSINIHYNCPMEGKYNGVILGNVGAKIATNTLLGKSYFCLLNAFFVDLIMAKKMAYLLGEENKQACRFRQRGMDEKMASYHNFQ